MKVPEVSLVVSLTLTLSLPLAAQTHQEELAQDLETVRAKVVGLAENVPESAYTWRPGEGVRSIGEVYMHIASANFRFPSMIGVSPPADTPEGWVGGDAEGLDRATAVAALNASFEFLDAVVHDVEDLEAPMDVFGRSTNVRGFLMLMQSHLHEHLGQSIAYARANGVVPPWSR